MPSESPYRDLSPSCLLPSVLPDPAARDAGSCSPLRVPALGQAHLWGQDPTRITAASPSSLWSFPLLPLPYVSGRVTCLKINPDLAAPQHKYLPRISPRPDGLQLRRVVPEAPPSLAPPISPSQVPWLQPPELLQWTPVLVQLVCFLFRECTSRRAQRVVPWGVGG